jgi:hypothetical protein
MVQLVFHYILIGTVGTVLISLEIFKILKKLQQSY